MGMLRRAATAPPPPATTELDDVAHSSSSATLLPSGRLPGRSSSSPSSAASRCARGVGVLLSLAAEWGTTPHATGAASPRENAPPHPSGASDADAADVLPPLCGAAVRARVADVVAAHLRHHCASMLAAAEEVEAAAVAAANASSRLTVPAPADDTAVDSRLSLFHPHGATPSPPHNKTYQSTAPLVSPATMEAQSSSPLVSPATMEAQLRGWARVLEAVEAALLP